MKWMATALALLVATGRIAQPTWQPDTNGDHVIDLDDFLDFLSIFGLVDADTDGFYGPVDDCPEVAGLS